MPIILPGRPARFSTSSGLLPGTSTSMGELQVRAMPASLQASEPSDLLRATSVPLSTLALRITRSLTSSGEVAEPQPVVPLPTLRDQSCFPARSKQNTPDLPKKTNRFLPSLTGVLEA